MSREARDWHGIWRPKPGSILANGSIVVQNHNPTYRWGFLMGRIFIEARRQYAAESFGWQATGRVERTPMGDQLVEVVR